MTIKSEKYPAKLANSTASNFDYDRSQGALMNQEQYGVWMQPKNGSCNGIWSIKTCDTKESAQEHANMLDAWELRVRPLASMQWSHQVRKLMR
jgi:hypothetical protein